MANRTVLVIDDEVEFIEAVRMRLEAGGYRVVAASDGREGMEKARRESPGLILLDLVMPRLNGFEALAALKSDPVTAHIPVIMLTAKGETEYILDAGKLGACDYLIKPISMQGLADSVAKHIL